MRLSTRGRFAVVAMIDVALREHQGPVSLAAVSARQHISLSYLEQLFAQLRRAGIVESTRGPGGGYTLGRRAENINVADIIGTVDPGEEAAGSPGAVEQADDMAQDLWQRLNTVMLEQMRSISLRQLVDDQRARGVTIEPRDAPSPRRGIAPAPLVSPVRPNVPNSVFALAAALTGRTRGA